LSFNSDLLDDWKSLLEELGQTQFFRDTVIPGNLEEILSGPWEGIFHAFAGKEFNAENLDFLRDVEKWEASKDPAEAVALYKKYVPPGAPTQVNLPDWARSELVAEHDSGQMERAPANPFLFDTARKEIIKLIKSDTYLRFKSTASKAQEKMIHEDEAAMDWDNIEGRDQSATVVEPELTMDSIVTDQVMQTNDYWLKNLKKGESIDFVQVGRDVLLGDRHDARYYPLLNRQPEHCKGTLTMVEKGGAFGPGEIRVTGTNNKDDFTWAISSITKKKITFA
jgi:hypothetical protein